MKNTYFLILALGTLSAGPVMAESEAVSQLFRTYAQQGATNPDKNAGQRLWLKTFTAKGTPSERSCSSCHGQDLKQDGKHVRTNKTIEPLAPSVNPNRLSKTAEIEKWFKRNCKWTFGRECTAREKADLLAYIRQL